MTGVVLAASGSILLGITGFASASLVRPRSGVALILTTYLMAWFALVVTMIALSTVGALDRVPLTAALVGLAACTTALAAASGALRSVPLPLTGRHARDVASDPAVAALACGIGIAMVYVCGLAFLTPPNDWDGLTYHVSRALLWMQQGFIGYVPAGNEPRLNGNPPVGDIGLLLLAALGRSDRLLAMPQFAALAASAVAVAGIARRIGATHAEAVFGALAFAGLPLVLLQGQSILNDLVLSSFVLAAIYFALGTERHDGPLAAVSLGLALGTKFVAALALPLVFLVVLVGTPRRRWLVTGGWLALGIVLGSPWYVLNLVETGSLDGDLTASTEQGAAGTLGAVVTTLTAMSVDVIDLSGVSDGARFLFVIAGLAVAAIGGTHALAARDRRGAETWGVTGLFVAAVPVLFAGLANALQGADERFWRAVGRADFVLGQPDNWDPQLTADTSLSWFGPAGAVAIAAALAVAILGVRRGQLRPVALVLALSPFLMMVIIALTIVWDPWRGRFLLFSVGGALAVWGTTLTRRRLAWLTTVLTLATLVGVLANAYTKPSGIGYLGTTESIWRMPWTSAITVVRTYDATRDALVEVEERVPQDARLALAVPVDTFLSPFAGRSFDRTLFLVADDSAVPAEADWLLTARGAAPSLCRSSWKPVWTREDDWALFRRTSPDGCRTR